MKRSVYIWLLGLVCTPALVGAMGAPVSNVLYLDGESGYVRLPAGIVDRASSVTVEAWVLWSDFGRFSRIFDFGREGHAVLVQNDKSSPRLNFVIYDHNQSRRRIQAKNAIEPHVWTHVAAVYGKEGMRFYLNGDLVGKEDYRGPEWLPERARFFIGRSNWDRDALFKGYMCEFRVWDTARTSREIRQTMYRRLTGDEDHLRAYWRFDRLEGRAARDLSPQGFHATLMGNAAIMTVPGPPIETAGQDLSDERETPGNPAEQAGVETYQILMQMALQDGQVDDGERRVLNRAAADHGLTEAARKRAEWQVHGELGTGPVDQAEATYWEILTAAYGDGVLARSEAALLELMKGRLGLSGERAQALKAHLALPAVEESPESAADAPVQKDGLRAYRDLVQTALSDRAIDPTEERMLASYRRAHGLSEVDAKGLELDVRRTLRIGPVNPEEETYFSLLKTALADGDLSASEVAMLEGLRSKMGISDRRAETLQGDIRDVAPVKRYGRPRWFSAQ